MANQTKANPAQAEISPYRLHLERQIIAAAFLIPSAAMEACTILSAQNFKHKTAKFLYQIIRTCFDRGECDATHYHREIQLHNDKVDHDSLDWQINADFFDENIREKCVILIELDMREKFGTALKQNELLAVANQDFERATVWKNAFDFIQNPRKDIFQAIPELKQYLKAYASAEDLEEFVKMESAIPGMIDRVRGLERSRRFIDTLTSLAISGDMEPHRRESVEILKDLLIQCISRLPIPATLNHSLTDLKRNLWQAPTQSPASNSF
jgi:hypothetical protein